MSLEAVAAWLVVAVAAIICGLSYAQGRWNVTVGVLFAVASFSAITAPTPIGSVRPEQGALIVLAVAVLVTRPREIWAVAAGAPLVAISALLYLGANVASSVLLAPSPPESLKIAAWLALSMAGMVIVAVLVRQRGHDLDLPRWIVGAACIQTLVGLAAVTSQAFFGTAWAVQVNDVVLGKTKGLSWEANLLAINIAMALTFVVLPGGVKVSSLGRLLLGSWLAVGLGLAYSRGGLIALAIAIGTVMTLLAWRHRGGLRAFLPSRLLPIAGTGSLMLVIALATIQVQAVLGEFGVGVTPDTVIIDEEPGGTPPPRASGENGSRPSPSASGPVRNVGTGDTVAVRIRSIRIGLREIDESPLVGLGTDSFRQRHDGDSCQCGAHIANLTFSAIYDSGAIGLVGLTGLLASAAWAGWRYRNWAYLGCLIVMVVGYQVTDAFRFASNWILLGCMFGLWLGGARTSEDGASERAGTGPPQ